MLLGPHETARLIESRHRPGWSVWYGARTRQYWAVACWVCAAGGMFGADTPEALEAAIATFETLHPMPGRRRHERPSTGSVGATSPSPTRAFPLDLRSF